MKASWQVYKADGRSTENDIERWLSTRPPWRRLDPVEAIDRPPMSSDTATERGARFVCSGDDEVLRVNMALMLRRPLLVTGDPGLGKSTLAYRIAWALGLEPPLRWEINSQSTLEHGLTGYDAVAHLRSIQLKEERSLGEFVTLGPLGTALLPTRLPRVLLIDEIDKSSFDLPNDLLHVFEEGRFVIPQLARLAGEECVVPWDARGQEDRVPVHSGVVSTIHHPVVVMTSNGERDFPPAFKRRCIPLRIARPDREHLAAIIRSHLDELQVDSNAVEACLDRYSDQATDVLLQALFLETAFSAESEKLQDVLKR